MKSILPVTDELNEIVNFEIDGIRCEKLNDKNSPNGYRGGTCYAFMHPEYVVKLSGSLRGEAKLFIEPEDRKYFAETVFVSLQKNFIVQKRVSFAPRLATREHQHILTEIAEKYNIGDITTNFRSMFNCTVDETGTPKIFDYDYIEDW